nr:hypothetical protein [Tanacetum cinerariifolium]
MVEKPMMLKKKDQIRLDEEAVLRLQAKLQAKFDEEQRLESEKAQKELEANIALIKTWDDVQAKLMCQEAVRDTIAQPRFENLSKLSNDLLLARGNTLQSDEDRKKFNELMELCTNLQSRVLDLEKTKTTQANKIKSLKRRVKKVKKSKGKDASKQGRIWYIDADKGITLVSTQDDAKMFDADKDLGGEEVFVEKDVADKEEIDEVTLAQALSKLKNTKPKVKGLVIQETSESTTNSTTIFTLKQKSRDKGKDIMVEKPMKLKKKDQIRLDEEAALRLQAELQTKLQAECDEEQRLKKEQDEFIDAEKATLFVQLSKKEESLLQQKERKRKGISHQHKLKREKSCVLISRTWTDFRTELMQGEWKEKRAGEELVKEVSKKQKIDDDKETTKIKQLMEIILDEEKLATDAIPLAVKSPKIVD